MIRGLHHVAISTPDADAALAFYRDGLGLEVLFDQAWPAGTEVADRITGLRDCSARQILLQAGNAFVELFQFRSPEPRPGDRERPVCDHGITHLCLEVDDLDAECARLAGLGMGFHSPPQEIPGGLRTVYGRDPDGNVIELHEFPVAHPVRLT